MLKAAPFTQGAGQGSTSINSLNIGAVIIRRGFWAPLVNIDASTLGRGVGCKQSFARRFISRVKGVVRFHIRFGALLHDPPRR